MPGHIRIGELARRTGLTPAVLRAWEDRYALLAPERSAGGTRLYSALDESRVRAMQTQMASGVSAAEAAAAVCQSVASLSGEAIPLPPAPVGVPDVGSGSDLRDGAAALGRALAQLDRAGAESALDGLLAAFTFETLASAVFLPYLVDVGWRWECGEASIAEEHLATHIMRARLLGLTRGLGQAPQARAVLACPPGEQHDIALVLLSVALERRGWQATLLGADTPVATIAEAAGTVGADIVVLAAVGPERFSAVSGELRALAAERPLLLAGPGASPALAEQSGAELLGGDPVSAAVTLDARIPLVRTERPLAAA